MVITLIRPPRLFSRTALTANVPVPPLALAYLAGALRDAGFTALAIDACGEAPDACRPLDDLPFVVNGLDVEEIAARVPRSGARATVVPRPAEPARHTSTDAWRAKDSRRRAAVLLT